MSRSVCTCSPLSPCSHRKHHQQSAEVKYRLMSYNHHSFTKPSAYINRSSMHLTTADYFWNVWKKLIWLFLSAVHKGAVITDKKETTRSGQESDSNKYKTSNQLKKKSISQQRVWIGRCVSTYLYSTQHPLVSAGKSHSHHILNVSKAQTCLSLNISSLAKEKKSETWTTHKVQMHKELANYISKIYMHYSQTHRYWHTCWVQPSKPSRRTLFPLSLCCFSLVSQTRGPHCADSDCRSPVQLQLFSSVSPPRCSTLSVFLSCRLKLLVTRKVCEACSSGGCYHHWLVVL